MLGNSTIITAQEYLGIIPMMPSHYLGIMEQNLALPCYNVKIAPLGQGCSFVPKFPQIHIAMDKGQMKNPLSMTLSLFTYYLKWLSDQLCRTLVLRSKLKSGITESDIT